MFENTLTETCTRLAKSASSDGNNRGAFLPDGDDLACLFVTATGRTVLDSGGNEVVIDGVIYTAEELTVLNRVAYDGWEYLIISARKMVDPMTTAVEGYKSYVSRKRVYNGTTVTISPTVGGG